METAETEVDVPYPDVDLPAPSPEIFLVQDRYNDHSLR